MHYPAVPGRLLRTFLFGTLLVPLAISGSQSAPRPTTARGVIEKFLALDSQAAGLSPATWPELGALTTWVASPGWTAFTIINRYEIGKTLEGHTRASVGVTYFPVGHMAESFTRDVKPEVVVYHLNKVGAEWKVDGPQLDPHVSYDVMKQRLQDRSTQDPKAKAANDTLLQQIDAARQGAH